MKKHQSTPKLKQLCKDKDYRNQSKTIFHYLQEHVATATMVSRATGIPQKNICRYKRDLEKVDLLWEIEKRDCQLTGCKAWYLTTDPKKAPKHERQLTLFGYDAE